MNDGKERGIARIVLRDLESRKDPKGGSPMGEGHEPKTEWEKARTESLKEEWRWRGQTEERLQSQGRDISEIKRGIADLDSKMDKVQLTLQAQVTKIVIIGGAVIWILTIISNYLLRGFFPVIR